MDTRRKFLQDLRSAGCGVAAGASVSQRSSSDTGMPDRGGGSPLVTLFFAGDVMTGRGIDQVLPRPSNPRIHEDYVKSALEYVKLAERKNGAIPKPAGFQYIWGDALRVWSRLQPDLRIVNLETSITTSEDWERKGINYRMHPANVGCLARAKIDCACLANNHVLDWGYAGLLETLETLRNARIRTAGAGRNLTEAWMPAVLDVSGKDRVLVFSVGAASSGIPPHWAATGSKPGIAFLANASENTADAILARVRGVKRPGDIAVLSIHWGDNWGYTVTHEHRAFAHRVLDGGVDVLHGHSSHHPKGIEVYRDKLILYGCGDFLNDYEGIGGHERFRSELALMYFATLRASTRELVRLRMKPLEIHRFRLRSASSQDTQWLRDMLSREGRAFGVTARVEAGNLLELEW
jgi:poly-gamma-glutamate synthesis protein (capsule biosynthesis protein)